MFRKMRRNKQSLSENDCVQILDTEKRGVLSVIGEDGYPYGFPMNYICIDGKIYFHSAREGHKIDAVKKDNRVSFCVINSGFRTEGEWSWNVSSVIVFGRVSFVEDNSKAEKIARALGNKYYPDAESVEEVMKQAFARLVIWELSIDHMSGKLVNES